VGAEEKCTSFVVEKKPEGNRPIKEPGVHGIILKWNGLGGRGPGSSGSGSGQVAGSGEYGNEISSCTKCGKLLDCCVTTSLMTRTLLYRVSCVGY
jgi:hypothetical protein